MMYRFIFFIPFFVDFGKALALSVSKWRGDITLLSYEKSIQDRGFPFIVGSDEVGRGAIAGPVVAASCCIVAERFTSNLARHDSHNVDKFVPIPGVADSKQLTEEERIQVFEQILEEYGTYKWTHTLRSPSDIDDSNIQKATMECFRDSIQNLILNEALPLEGTYAVVDGKSTPKLVGGPTPVPCRPFVKADEHVYVVAMASIIAKVTRDRIMSEASEQYPQYSFHKNKGYSTREHIEAIHKYGPCPLHRMSFKGLKNR